MSYGEETIELHVALLAFREAWADGEVYETYPEVISSVPLDQERYERCIMGHKEIVEGLRFSLSAGSEGWAKGAVSDEVYAQYLDLIARSLHSELVRIEEELAEEQQGIFARIKRGMSGE